jgi:DMSO/TMAO reductase YedYZ molybdopterin-dependent catalytic subunit
LIEIVKPRPEAKVVAFYSYGDALYGGEYYDTQTIETALKARCLLAYEMNQVPLPEVYGAPLRLRVENQLGYKMVKWIERIEFVETEKTLGKGEGGKNEDDEYFDILPNIWGALSADILAHGEAAPSRRSRPFRVIFRRRWFRRGMPHPHFVGTDSHRR